MFDAIDFQWNKKEKGLVVERRPIYYNERMVDEELDVSLHYRLSDFKNRETMYNKILADVETLKNRLIEAQKQTERKNKR